METSCFLSSTSFPKSMEVNSRFARQNFNKYHHHHQSRKFTSVTCCQSGATPAPSLPPKDEPNLTLTSTDWRAFRAKLVLSNESDSLSLLNPSVVDNNNNNKFIPIGENWAHTIPNLEKGCLLIATEKQDGVHIFERAVILILSTGPIGPTGLILNRPSLMSIKEMRSSTLDAFSDSPLFFGGPMEEDGLFLLSPDEKGIANVEKTGAFEEVMRGLYCGRMEKVEYAATMVEEEKIRVRDFRFFDGYCAWEGTQLREEIRNGYWALAACSPSIIGLSKDGRPGLWDEVIGLISPTKVW